MNPVDNNTGDQHKKTYNNNTFDTELARVSSRYRERRHTIVGIRSPRDFKRPVGSIRTRKHFFSESKHKKVQIDFNSENSNIELVSEEKVTENRFFYLIFF